MKLILIVLISITYSTVFSQSDIVINEIMSDNISVIADEDGDFSDWIELHNFGAIPINLMGYGISDNEDNPFEWIFPSTIIPPGGFKIIFASGKDKLVGPYLHTNFRISSEGEPLILTDASGVRLDSVRATPLSQDLSFGRTEDGGTMWERLNEANPAEANTTSNGIIFSHQSGFYAETVVLVLEATNDHEIRYSTDGTDPRILSTAFADFINLEDLEFVPDVISNISTSPSWSAPDTDNFKAHVIKAATFEAGIRTSKVYTKVIFINPDLNERYEGFDIVSLVTDPGNLFDADTGIYVPGVHYTADNPTWSGNYFQKGDLWERKANLQYFNNEGQLQFNQEIRIRSHGGKGRNLPQKSLRIYTKSDDGAPKLNYPFFEHLDEDKCVFDKVILRNSLTCWNNSVIKDEVTAHVCRDLNIEIQNSKPVVLFVNGEYWGVQSIREFYDEKFINEKYDVPEDSVNIVIHGSGNRPGFPLEWGVSEGTNIGHIQLYDFLNSNDLDIPANYEYVKTVIDIESIIDYYCAEIYFNNKDWPTNNNKLWNDGSFGTWKQMLYDIDGGWQYLGTGYDQLDRALSATGSGQNSPYATFLLRKLFESASFQDHFLSRMACLMNTDFEAETVVATINFMKDLYVDGMQEHVDRWHRPNSYATWLSGVNGMIAFANGRRDFVIGHIEDQFSIDFDPEDYDCESIVYSTGVEVELEDQLRIYPNPAIEKTVWVDFDFSESLVDYQIRNLTGQLLDQGEINNHAQLEMNFSAGTYFLIILVNEQSIAKRIVIP
ncbi:MAG: hypothetical protein ACI8ZM_000153 [Crocinitomix sp.]|jgi:hypothetical protein